MSAPGAEAPRGRGLARALALAVVLGPLGAIGGTLFLDLTGEGQAVLFREIPERAGWGGPPWWYVAILLLVGAGLVAVGQRLPGGTGPSPLTGFHFDAPLPAVPSILVAIVGTLVFGFALGPEAPLIILGSAIGAIVALRAEGSARRLAMLLGGIAAIGAVFGNPLIAGVMALEVVAFGLAPAIALAPLLVAIAAGYLVQVGLWTLPGVGVHALTVPGLPAYDRIDLGDLALGVVVAVVSAVVAIATREVAVGFDRVARRRRRGALVAVALVTALAFAVAVEGFGAQPDEVLLGGAAGLGGLVAETSLGLVLVIVLAKGVAFAAALGGGMRGGQITPAVFLGVAVGVGASLIVDGSPLSPLVAVGIAATAAVLIRLPATSSILGVLLIAGAGAAIVPFAIIGGVVGFLARSAADAALPTVR